MDLAVNWRFKDKSLVKIYTEPGRVPGYSDSVVRGFRKVMQVIDSAHDERDLQNMRSLNFERLKGKRANQWSVRINKQMRLILEIERAENPVTVVVVAIEDYH